MSYVESVDADIAKLRRTLKKLDSDKDLKGQRRSQKSRSKSRSKSKRRSSSSSSLMGSMSSNINDDFNDSRDDVLQGQSPIQRQKQKQHRSSSLATFEHLSASTRNLGQRKSSIGASRALVVDSNGTNENTEGVPPEVCEDVLRSSSPRRASRKTKQTTSKPRASGRPAHALPRSRTISLVSADGSASIGGVFGDSEADFYTTGDDGDDEQDLRQQRLQPDDDYIEDDMKKRFHRTNSMDNNGDYDDDDDDPDVGLLKRHDMNGISQFDMIHESFGMLKGSAEEDTTQPLRGYGLRSSGSSYEGKKGSSDDDVRYQHGQQRSTDESTNSRGQGFLLTRRQESYRNIRTISMQPQVARQDYSDSNDNSTDSGVDDKDDDNVANRCNAFDVIADNAIVHDDNFRLEKERAQVLLRDSKPDDNFSNDEDGHNQHNQRRLSSVCYEEQTKLPPERWLSAVKKRDLSINSSEPQQQQRRTKSSQRTIARSLSSAGKTRRSSYVHVMPLAIAPDGSAAISESTQVVVEAPHQEYVSAVTDYYDEEDYYDDDHYVDNFDDDHLTAFELLCSPSFSQFALLEIQPQQLLLLENEYLFADEGPNHLDSFLLSQDLDFGDHFTSDTNRPIDPTSVSVFCFPEGLRVRYIPKAGLPGAKRLGWIGTSSDRCHILVFTNGNGFTDHGVAIMVQWEMNLKRGERQVLSKAILSRRKRRSASRRIQRWWRQWEQARILREALDISGFPDHSPGDLKWKLEPNELKFLEKSFKRPTMQRQPDEKSLPGHASRRQLRKRGLKKSLSTSFDAESTKVVELTRAAISRLKSASNLQQDEASRESMVSDDSPECEEPTKARRGFGMLKGVSPRTSSRFSMRSVFSTRSMPSLSPMTPSPRMPVRKLGKHIIDRARESYETMKQNDRLGSICVVEKCYTLIGCQPDEHALLLGPLQQLVNAERSEILEFRQLLVEKALAKKKSKERSANVDEERRLEEELKNRRHVIIKTMREKLRLTMRQALITYPRSQLDHITGKIHYFETLIPQIPDCEVIKVPLPLPRVGKEWALAQFLLDVGPDSLVLCLKLLLLERSILVVGDNLQIVSMCACALIELLKPFEWSNAFMPVLPLKMLNFVNCPVPFVAGVAVPNVTKIEKDHRILEAMANGMSLLNLKSNTLQITTEKGMSGMISLDPYLREKLHMIRARLQYYVKEDPYSSLRNFHGFVRNGLARRESLTLISVCRVLEQHFSQFCVDLAVNDKAWQRYGTVNANTNDFKFNPEWFLNHIRADHAFHEAFVQTQLFSGYVHERREDRIEMHEIMEGELGCFIAEWVYDKWMTRKKSM